MGFGAVLLFFFVPETAYPRAAYLETDLMSTNTPAGQGNSSPLLDSGSSNEKQIRTTTEAAHVPTARDRYLLRLLPYNGLKSDVPFWKLFLRPFPLFFHPAVVWSCLMQGVIIGWTVMVGV